MSGNIFDGHDSESAIDIYWVEAWEAAEHSIMPRKAPFSPAKNYRVEKTFMLSS